MTDTAIEAADLDLSYRRRGAPALRGCSFRLPAGRVCALVGPNGAGKSTLLALAAAILRPTRGHLAVLGTDPAAARPRVAYVAQDKPLYPQLTVAETLRLGAELNPGRWDAARAGRVLADAGVDPRARVRSLSGGQRTRVALALALGKRAELLLLDEPMADLDPLVRHRLMGTLMGEAAEHGTTVVMSSHIVGELADVCDHVLLLSGGRVRLGGGIDDLTHAHALVTGARPLSDLDRHTVVESRAAGRGLTALIRPEGPLDAGWQVEEPSLEELLLAHLRAPAVPPLLTPGTTAAHRGVAA
ncbi:ABC transporter ATP-binding protein [Streptomyces longispororuber]|uniref:ABC transporter ATP-binding protein n=1 Tax=Streptomyces longispororuber TaxID=68230 RepID=A0A918ZLF3_9ACTN|nr:ABC transporter ATP-binding protein [Streptomyces longispororuber]GHE57519.1 ABC transporter ATP-binding protein [Streptomyces longispororuber]